MNALCEKSRSVSDPVGLELQGVVSKPNQGLATSLSPLQEQQVLLKAEPSLQTHILFLSFIFILNYGDLNFSVPHTLSGRRKDQELEILESLSYCEKSVF